MTGRVPAAWLALILLIVGVWFSPYTNAAESRAMLDSFETLPLDNLLKNSDFRSPEDWIFKGDSSIEVGVGRGGTRGAIQRSAIEYESEIVQTIGSRLVPGRRYTVTAWVRSLSDDAIAVIGVRWDGGHPRVFRGISPSEGWVKIEFRFVAPTRDGWRQVVLSGAGTLVWDRVMLFESETLEARLAATWEERLARGDEIYTGLVVNARGTDLQRGRNPKIYDEEGQLVFAGITADDDQMNQGIAVYATDLAMGTAHPRLEVNSLYPLRVPLVVDAQRAVDAHGTRILPITSVVVGKEDADRIRRAVQNYDFLGRFAIVFVLQPLAGF